MQLSVKLEKPKITKQDIYKMLKVNELFRRYIFISKYADYNEKKYEDAIERLATFPVKYKDKLKIKDINKLKIKIQRYRYLLSDCKFIPAGRILAGLNIQDEERKLTLANCYVIPIKEDSIEGIYKAMYECAKTMSRGGGVGIDISTLRPTNAPCKNSAYTSTGAVSFMELFSLTTGTIGQKNRRGAMMITINSNHPDVKYFISIKNDEKREKVRYANISVKIDDEFMKAVKNDNEYLLHFKGEYFEIKEKIKAKELWKKIVKNAYECAEPGVIFIDTIKKYSNWEYYAETLTSNPCSEQFLPAYGNCLLGSLNLKSFVKNKFHNPYFDFDEFKRCIEIAVEYMNDVLEIANDKHPLEEQIERGIQEMRIGIGIMGLHDVFIYFNQFYTSDFAFEITEKIMKILRDTAYRKSIKIAKKKGSFPEFSHKIFNSEFIKNLPEDIQKDISKYGLRNVALLSIAPTGSISLIAGCSNSLEPYYSFVMERFALSNRFLIFANSLIEKICFVNNFDYNEIKNQVEKELDLLILSLSELANGNLKSFIENELKEKSKNITSELLSKVINYINQDEIFLENSLTVNNDKRIKLQGIIQKYIDNAISNTYNLPKSATEKDVENIFMKSYENNLKSVSVFVDNSRENIIKCVNC